MSGNRTTAIARAAGENVLRYLRLLRDAASETNPAFRVITSLSWFGAEKDIILNGLGDRLDLYLSPADTTDTARWRRMQALESKSSHLFNTARAAANYRSRCSVPWLSHDRLAAAVAPGMRHLAVTFDPPSLVAVEHQQRESSVRFSPDLRRESVTRSWSRPPAAGAESTKLRRS